VTKPRNLPAYSMRRFSLLAPICVCTLSTAYGDVMKLPAATRRMQSQPFVTTPECKDKCSRIDISTNTCDSDEMLSCICVSSTDKYCGYACNEDNLSMMCQSRRMTHSPTMVHKPFVTTPECKDPCSKIDISTNTCDSNEMRSCICASPTDKYCGYECDENNLSMMCQSRGDTRSPTKAPKNKKGTKDKTTNRPKQTKGPKASKVPKSSGKATKTLKSKSSKSKDAKS